MKVTHIIILLAELSNYMLFPEFYKTELKYIKDEIGHFITKNEKTVRVNYT